MGKVDYKVESGLGGHSYGELSENTTLADLLGLYRNSDRDKLCIMPRKYDMILNTNIAFDVPYFIDVDKYKNIINDSSIDFSSYNSVIVSAKIEVTPDYWGDIKFYSDVFVFPYTENDSARYDCFLNVSDATKLCSTEFMESHVKRLMDITSCFIGIDEDGVKMEILNTKDELKQAKYKLDRLRKLI